MRKWNICNAFGFGTMRAIAIAFFVAFALRAFVYHVQNPAAAARTDFGMRYNEAECVVSGENPHNIYTSETEHPKYVSYDLRRSPGASSKKWVAAYPPWEYTFMMPLLLVPVGAAFGIWFVLTLTIIACAVRWVHGLALKRGFTNAAAWSLALTGLSFYAFAFFWQISYQNHAAILLAAAIGMIWFLDREDACILRAGGPRSRHFALQIGAGFCWALLMMKPQTGLLALFPLLFARKWITMISAVVFCLAGTIPPMLLCGDSALSLLTKYMENGTDHYNGSLLLPDFVMRCVGAGALSAATKMYVSMTVGALVCAALSWHLRKCEGWIVKTMPWLALAPAWTYSWPLDTLVWMIPAAVFLFDTFRAGETPTRIRVAGFWLFVVMAWMISLQAAARALLFLPKLLARVSSDFGERFGDSQAWLEQAGIIGAHAKILYVPALVLFAVWVWKFARKSGGRE